MGRTIFHGPKAVQAIEVQLYFGGIFFYNSNGKSYKNARSLHFSYCSYKPLGRNWQKAIQIQNCPLIYVAVSLILYSKLSKSSTKHL